MAGGFLNLLDATLNFTNCWFRNFSCWNYDSLMKATKSILYVENITISMFDGVKPGSLFKFGQET